MKRSALTWLTVALLVLVTADLVVRALDRGRRPRPAAPAVAGGGSGSLAARPATSAPPAAAEEGDGSARPRAAPPAPDPHTIERLARLAARQQLRGVGVHTYIDSLILTTDSVVRRWPERGGAPLRVAIVEGGIESFDPRMADYAREAFVLWEAVDIGVRFALVADTTSADIIVRWIDRFEFDRAGQTDLTWDQLGNVRRATIALAVHTNTGVPLPEQALLSVAVHEAGHAIGLPHSADSNDVMYPATRTGLLSERDRRTVTLLYHLPPGPVRDGAP